MTVYRCFVEKRPEFAVEAKGVEATLKTVIRSGNLEAVRLFNRYDLEDIDPEDYQKASVSILSEPQVDVLYHEAIPAAEASEWVLAVEYLPGQFDQRADSAEQCVKLLDETAEPIIRSGVTYVISGELSDAAKQDIEKYLVSSDGKAISIRNGKTGYWLLMSNVNGNMILFENTDRDDIKFSDIHPGNNHVEFFRYLISTNR